MFDWITDLIRSLVWSIAHGSLIVSDWLMDLMQLTFGINLGENKSLWVFFRMILVILVIVTPIFAFIYYFKWLEESENTEFQGEKILKRLLKVALTVVLLPTVFTFMMMFAQKTDEWTSSWIGYDEKFTPSEMILTNTARATIQSDYNEITNNNISIKLDDFDINKKAEGQDETYEYYNGWVELFFGVGISIAMIYIMFMNFVPFAIRFIMVLFKVILAPVPLAYSIIPTSNSYDDWLKGLSVDVMLNAVQLFALKVTLILFGVSGIFKAETSLIRAIFLLIALYASSQVPNLFANFFGVSDQQANATLKAGLQARGLKGMVKGAIGLGAMGAGVLGNALGGVGSLAGQKMGQWLGGDSLNELNEKGILSQNNPFNASSKGFGSSIGGNAFNNAMQSDYDDSYNDSRQHEYYDRPQNDNFNSSGLGNIQDETVNNSDNASFRAKQAVFSNDNVQNEPFNEQLTGNHSESVYKTANNDSNNDEFNENQENMRSNHSQFGQKKNNNQGSSVIRVTREGSKARSFADKVENMSGIKGSIGRGISRSSKHAYLSMAQRADRTFARNVSKKFTQDPLEIRNPMGNNNAMQSDNRNNFSQQYESPYDDLRRNEILNEERDKQ